MQYVSESFEAPPLISSADLPWQGVRVEQYHLEAGELPAHHHSHHLLMLYQVEKPFILRLQRPQSLGPATGVPLRRPGPVPRRRARRDKLDYPQRQRVPDGGRPLPGRGSLPRP
ncbi:MAG: hypothetical protein WKG07_16740 [Hymenobacter sp.]